MDFKEFLMKEYNLGETSANQYVHRLNGLLDRGIYNGETSITPNLLAIIQREYGENSVNHYSLTLKRYLAFQQSK